jgi:hypothetical protein
VIAPLLMLYVSCHVQLEMEQAWLLGLVSLSSRFLLAQMEKNSPKALSDAHVLESVIVLSNFLFPAKHHPVTVKKTSLL